MITFINIVNIAFCTGIIFVGYRAIQHYSKCNKELKKWNYLYDYLFSPTGSQINLEEYPTQREFKERITGIPEKQRNTYINMLITREYKYKIDTQLLNAQSCMEQLPNLGLLGTVLGLVIGYWFFDGKNMDIIVSCSQTALWTTLVGLGFMVFIKSMGIDSDTETEYERFLGYVKHLSSFSENNSCVVPDSHPFLKL